MEATDYYEFGVLLGVSFRAPLTDNEYRWCFGFDSFVGLPKEVDGLGEDGSIAHDPRQTEGVYSLVTGIGNQTHTFSKGSEEEYNSLDEAVEAIKKGLLEVGDNFSLIPKFYSELNSEDVKKYAMRPAKYVYLDCDLYISARDALEFLIQNDLLVEGSKICYDDWDQFDAFDYPEFEGGVSKAHKDITLKYNIKWESSVHKEFTFISREI